MRTEVKGHKRTFSPCQPVYPDFTRSSEVLQYSVQYFLQYFTYLAGQWWQTHGTDQLVKLHPLAELQQGDVVIVVVWLEVRMEDDLLDRAVGGETFVPSIMDSEEHLEGTQTVWTGSCWAGCWC